MSYKLELTGQAESHLMEWKKSGRKKILLKIACLLEEITLHPRTGSGHVEPLKGDLSGFWSRRIDKGSRIVYKIDDDKVLVTIISMRKHYSDK